MFHTWQVCKNTEPIQSKWWIHNVLKFSCYSEFYNSADSNSEARYGPKCSADPIKLTHIWKWEFENGTTPYYTYGALQPWNKRSNIMFEYERLQIGHKLNVYELDKA